MQLTEEKEGFSRKRDYRKVLKGMFGYARAETVRLSLALILVFASNTIVLWGPRFSGMAIDAMGFGGGQIQADLAIRYALLMLAAYLSRDLLGFLLARFMGQISQTMIRRMRQDSFNKIVELPLAYIDSHQAGDLVSRISYDLDLVNSSLSQDVIAVAAAAITVVGSLSMMFAISAELSFMFLLLVPATVLFTIYRIQRTRPLFSRRSRKLGQMNAYVEEILFGQKSIRAYGREGYFTDNFDEINGSSMDAYYEADYQASMNGPSVSLITNISLAFIAIFGSILYLDGRFSLGELSAFILLSRRFSGPINEIANIVAELQSAASAAERVFTLLEQDSEPADAPDAEELKEVRGEVEFQDVSFAYNPGQPVIEKLSLKAKAGSLTAIVGPTGAGKTTLINLLMRFYDPDQGRILVDGKDTRKLTRKSLREAFAMVLQDSWLFNGSIRENITYGRPEASEEDIRAAAKAAHMDDFIEGQPQGYDSEISDGASNLSQGQKQLLTIARAMLLKSPLLILDEATSHVDSRTEISIQSAMNRLMEGRTSFVIAHRLSTIRHADNILVVEDGKIVEQGNHEQLLAQNGVYARLYQAQFS